MERKSIRTSLLMLYSLPSAQRIFTKLMKIAIALMRKLCIRITIYLHNILLIRVTLKEFLMAQDILIYLLHLSQPSTSIRTLSKLIDRLASTAAAILPAQLQHRPLQQQIHGRLSKNSLEEKVTLSDQEKRELNWCIPNLNPNNEKFLITSPSQVSSDA